MLDMPRRSPTVRDTVLGPDGCGILAPMVLEVALIDVTAGQEAAFRAAYAEARHLPAATPGCGRMRMTQGVETPTRFVLLIEWDSVDAHEVFRDDEGFARWRELIGPYFAAPPHVEHFVDV
jgi:heme-degrading monooxygenase HmoA